MVNQNRPTYDQYSNSITPYLRREVQAKASLISKRALSQSHFKLNVRKSAAKITKYVELGQTFDRAEVDKKNGKLMN